MSLFVQINNFPYWVRFERKPTDQNSYLQVKSEHPRALKNNIARSQTLRAKPVCSTGDEY